jgi:hypothetical protein
MDNPQHGDAALHILGGIMGGGEARSTRKKVTADKPEKLPARRSSARSAVAPANSEVPPDERHRMIAEAAYHRAQQRGFTNGDPLQDWLDAEAQLEMQIKDGIHRA